ncbi:MAG: hypothetical protein WD810_00995 [Solirubrobacterales bacterium]
MNEARLRSLLRERPIPAAEDAERRGLEVVTAAFAQRRPARRSPLPRLALAAAVAGLLAALLLSPAGAAVRDWVDDVFTAGVPDAEPGLTEIPGGGRLLVQSPAGPWVVQPDGSRRLLGDYQEATWSPRGLFVGAVSGRTLSAVEPGGTPHWSLSAPSPVSDPRWSPSGLRIAFRAGDGLWVVDADGSDSRRIDPSVAAPAAAWSPHGLALLAYVDADGRLRIANADSGEIVGSAEAAAGVETLEWGGDGSTLVEGSWRSLRLRRLTVSKAIAAIDIGPPRALALPADGTVRDAALSPDGATVAILVERGNAVRARSEVLLIDARGHSRQHLFTAPGRLAELAFSPDGGRLLITWPEADQWLFVPADGRGRVRAIGGIAAEFAPGDGGAPRFPRVDGWCCRATVASSLR